MYNILYYLPVLLNLFTVVTPEWYSIFVATPKYIWTYRLPLSIKYMQSQIFTLQYCDARADMNVIINILWSEMSNLLYVIKLIVTTL